MTLVKHVFKSHILLQFDCTNTVAEQVLENVSVSLDLTDAVSLDSLFPHPQFPETRHLIFKARLSKTAR